MTFFGMIWPNPSESAGIITQNVTTSEQEASATIRARIVADASGSEGEISMNEHEWQKARDPEAMLAAVQDRLSQRKWVLLNCAVARRMAKVKFNPFAADFAKALEFNPTTVIVPDSSACDSALRALFPGNPPFDYDETQYSTLVGKVLMSDAHEAKGRSKNFCQEGMTLQITLFARLVQHNDDQSIWESIRAPMSMSLLSFAKAEISAAVAAKFVWLYDENKSRTNSRETGDWMRDQERRIHHEQVLDMNKAMRNYAKPANELLAHFLQEQLGNPFQPYEFDPLWRTSDVMGLARGIEADRGFDRMHMLADALMEAGCEHEAILLHLQEQREHQRGCWVLDLILGHDLEIFAREPIEDFTGTGGRHEPLGLAQPRNYDA